MNMEKKSNDIESKGKKLIEVSKFKKDSDYDTFSELIEELSECENNPDILRYFIKSFNEVDAGEIQFELVEACEEFDDKIYIPIFLEEGLSFAEKAPTWFGLMFQTILNTKSCMKVFYKSYPTLSETERNFYLDFIRQLERENKEYAKILKKIETLKID